MVRRRWVRWLRCWRSCFWSSGSSRSWPGSAGREAGRRADERLRHGDADRVAVRLRAASEPDRLRVRRGPQRCPAGRPPRARDGRPGQGRIGLRPRDPRRRADRRASRRPSVASGSACCSWRSDDANGRDRSARAAPLRACVLPGRPTPFRSSSAARCAVRLWARRTGRPARNSTTVIPHRSIDHIQKRSSGRSNRVSRATLNTPSWPTTIDHGWSGGGIAVAGDLRPVERARAARPSPSRASSVAERRPDACRDLGERLAAGCPDFQRRSAPGRRARLRSGRRSRRGAGPASRPGRSRGSRDRARRVTLAPRSAGSRRSIASAVSRRPAQRRVDELERVAARAPAGRAAACGAARRLATSAAWRRPVRGQRRCRPGPGSGPRRCTSTRRGGRGRASRRGRPG